MNTLPDEHPAADTLPEVPSHKSLLQTLLRGFVGVRFWGYGLFWSWNLIFLAFMLLGFAPNLLPEMFSAMRAGLIPAGYLLLGGLLTLIPVFAVLLGATWLRRSPGKLLALGYGIQGPVMLLLFVRLFIVRQANAAVLLLYGVALLGTATLLWQLLDRRIDGRGLPFDAVRSAGLTLLLLVGVYAALLIAFYAVPVMAALPQFFVDAGRDLWRSITELSWRTLGMLPFVFLGFALLFYSATLFVVAPVVVPVLYIVHWFKGLKAVAVRRGAVFPAVLSAVVTLVVVALFVVANRQPQHKAYNLLENLPQTTDDAQALLHQQASIRRGLLNAYLSPVRYISAVGEVGHVQGMYVETMDMPEEAALRVEHFYEVVARPFLYEPMLPAPAGEKANRWEQRALRNEPGRAAELYEAFFDMPIIEGERQTIVAAVRDTWSGDQALTAWQAVDDREILLTRQEVNVSEHGDWAEIELFEAYQNQTSQRQEVVYYFSLPETAVLTGIWLGNSPDRDERSAFHVAPRGAAQQVYREQVRMNIDPALLEQLGPRQYRLRVFPVEAQRWTWNESTRLSTMTPGPQVYMWMTYRVLAEGNAWPLPQLAEKANVFWNRDSLRRVNGTVVDGFTEAWLPASVAAAQPVTPEAHQVTFPTGETILIRPALAADLPSLPADLRLAVVLDRSHSMTAQSAAVTSALARLEAAGPDVDVYLTASAYRGEQASLAKLADVVPGNIVYYGGQNAAELLQQYFALSAGRDYDALFVLTDGSGFKLGGEAVEVRVPNAPVWMIHLGGDFPMGYDDATLQAIQASGGGVAGSLDDAFARLAVSLAAGQTTAMRDVVDGYEWVSIPAGVQAPAVAGVAVHAPGDPFAALAARRLILSEMYRQRGQIAQVETLDALHALAVEQGIVTPYSSMIVLVTQAQERRLAQLEGQVDRFEREAEAVGETVAPFAVTGVPEPHEWLLIGLAAVMLGWLAWRRRAGVALG
ncbi:MAG: TIGR02921 family PEP-CTERM protein [Chloroflexota bacterium]